MLNNSRKMKNEKLKPSRILILVFFSSVSDDNFLSILFFLFNYKKTWH